MRADWAGIGATTVAAVEGSYCLLPPLNSIATNRNSTASLVALIFVGAFISVLVRLLRSNHDRLKAALIHADELRAALDEHAHRGPSRIRRANHLCERQVLRHFQVCARGN